MHENCDATGSWNRTKYGYDALYRLTSETITSDPGEVNGTVTYTLDPVGNRLSRTSTLAAVPSTSNTYDANDRIVGTTYDLNGNTTASGANTYTYDSENRLKQATPAGVTLVYDGDGIRVAGTTGSVTTSYLVDTMNPTGLPQVLEELTAAGAVQRVYTYGIARVSESQILNNAWTTSFYGYDGHGSVRFMASASGTITDTYQYDAFGIQLAASGTTPNVYRYAGEPLDQALQMIYLRARYMSPAAGRFWSTDTYEGSPGEPQSLHKYLYAACDPVNNTDPSGHIPWAAFFGDLAIAGLIYWTIGQGFALNEGAQAQRDAGVMIDAALDNLRSQGDVLGKGHFLREFMGRDYMPSLNRMPNRSEATAQLARVTAAFESLDAGVRRPIGYIFNPWFVDDLSGTRAQSPPWPGSYYIFLQVSFFWQAPEERARIIVHELCHITLDFEDHDLYGDATEFTDPLVLAKDPEPYSYYALSSGLGLGP